MKKLILSLLLIGCTHVPQVSEPLPGYPAPVLSYRMKEGQRWIVLTNQTELAAKVSLLCGTFQVDGVDVAGSGEVEFAWFDHPTDCAVTRWSVVK